VPTTESPTPSLTETAASSTSATDRDLHRKAIAAHAPRNLIALAAHHIVLRVAWIFKTESVIMPAFLDAIVPGVQLQGLLRGCLPILNRFGQSIPPLLLADRLRRTHHKKWPLLATTVLMGLPFLVLSATWFALENKHTFWLPILFLVLYTLFFSMTGLNQLCFATLQGKLIRADRRGRLMGLSGLLGAGCSIVCAWFLLQRWLAIPDNGTGEVGGFGYIFGFAGVGFVLAGLLVIGVREPADHSESHRRAGKNQFREAWRLLRRDHNFRKLAVVGMLFTSMQLLFPHYQALGRNLLNLDRAELGFHLMLWVIAQNAGAGLFSILAGLLADRYGNRLAIRIESFLAASAPIWAVLVTRAWFPYGEQLFWISFFLLSLVPVTMKTMVNYALELGKPEDHPHYISTLKLAMAVPFLLSPLVGWLGTIVGFETIFTGICVLIAAAGLLTFGLEEPRHRILGD
jgi:MFS family permease